MRKIMFIITVMICAVTSCSGSGDKVMNERKSSSGYKVTR